MIGWISIHRKIKEHWVWEEKPFSKGQAWIDLLMMANHEDKKVLLGAELIEVKRGSRITSIRKLCDRWGWSNTKVNTFLKLLKQDGMIEIKSDTKKTTLTIVNYSDYQYSENHKTSDKNHASDTQATRKHTNNNDNNDNNDNKYKSVVDYLNKKANKNFKSTTKGTQRFINARMNEGFTLDDFIKVIDKKTNQWLGGEMEQYLRPQTLFGTKFESYLNERGVRDGREAKGISNKDAINETDSAKRANVTSL